MKCCFLDMDGIIADFVTGACKLHKLANPYEKPEYQGVYGIENIFDMTPKQFWAPIDYNFWRKLNVMPDAYAIVEAVTDIFGVNNVCLLSSPCNTRRGECIDGKIDWLGEHFPQFSKNVLFGSAKKFCASTDALLIDDLDYNVDSFRKHGGVAWLFPRPWNSEHANQISCTSSSDLKYEIKYHLNHSVYLLPK